MRTAIVVALTAGAFLQLAGPTVGAASANCRLRAPASAGQLITVEAARYRTTAASLGSGAARAAVGSRGRPVDARVGLERALRHRREGDGTTPTGVFTIGRTIYGNAPNPGVRYRYRRLVCGDWWNEDPRSPTYNTFQHVRCGPPAVPRDDAGPLAGEARTATSR